MMTHQELYARLATLEGEMEDAYNRHDISAYFDAKERLHELELEYCHMLD